MEEEARGRPLAATAVGAAGKRERGGGQEAAIVRGKGGEGLGAMKAAEVTGEEGAAGTVGTQVNLSWYLNR